MDPTRPSQPPKAAAYTVEGNATTSNPEETRSMKHSEQERVLEERLPGSRMYEEQEGMPQALGQGIRGAPPSHERYGSAAEQAAARSRELDGEQMRPPGEGAVNDAVRRKPGASGSQPDLASDLDRKKAEQASKREAMKQARQTGAFNDHNGLRGDVETETDRLL
ncbi:hypothetical protein BX600DRAFT_433951 [Xylariales sp. PMI_506]|nr:hypothetical protein BX600DRAFT_433951 [Xylariales sp. PMI_506]